MRDPKKCNGDLECGKPLCKVIRRPPRSAVFVYGAIIRTSKSTYLWLVGAVPHVEDSDDSTPLVVQVLRATYTLHPSLYLSHIANQIGAVQCKSIPVIESGGEELTSCKKVVALCYDRRRFHQH